MTLDELAKRALALSEAASPGPWMVGDTRQGNWWRTVQVVRMGDPPIDVDGEGQWANDTAALIAFARNHIDELAGALLKERSLYAGLSQREQAGDAMAGAELLARDVLESDDPRTLDVARELARAVLALRKVEQAARPLVNAWPDTFVVLGRALSALDGASRAKETP